MTSEHGTPLTMEGKTLAEVLTGVVRRASDMHLVAAAISGLAGVLTIALVVPGWWRTIPLFICIGALGLWGIGDREREATGARGVAYTALRGVAAMAGGVAAIILAAIAFTYVLGTWIS
jgi:hypothetical protein